MTLVTMRVTAMQSAVEGVKRAEQKFEQTAGRIAQAFTIDISEDASTAAAAPDFAQETVEQIRAVAAYQANLKTLQTADEVTGVVVELGRRG